MNKCNRYFRVTSGRIIEEVKIIIALNKAADIEYRNIIKEIGAEEGYYQIDNKLTCIVFKTPPDSGEFKKIKSCGWYPKRSTKKGKELHKRFEDIKTRPESELLKLVGLRNSPTIFLANRCYRPLAFRIPSKAPIVFFQVPWFDEDPEVLKQYVKDRNAGTRGDGNFDAILWKPSDEMIEVKEWQVKKELDEWNSKIKQESE